jgi:hypothetical protein
MDPLTVTYAAIQLATAALTLATKVWDATPAADQAASAANYAQFNNNIGAFILAVQAKLKLP